MAKPWKRWTQKEDTWLRGAMATAPTRPYLEIATAMQAAGFQRSAAAIESRCSALAIDSQPAAPDPVPTLPHAAGTNVIQQHRALIERCIARVFPAWAAGQGVARA